jgi:hypothetical protein
VAEMTVVDAAALLCLGGSECIVFASKCIVGGPGMVLRRFSIVVCRSEMGRPSDIVVVICDVADDAGGSELESGGCWASWDKLGDGEQLLSRFGDVAVSRGRPLCF